MKKIGRPGLTAGILQVVMLSLFLSAGMPAFAYDRPADEVPTFTVEDFEAVYRLDAEQEGRLYRIRLDDEIFREIKRSIDGDLAIFDSSGTPLPFEVRDIKHPYAGDAAAAAEETKGSGEFRIPLFPMPREEHSGSGLGDITIRTDQGGRVIEIAGNDRPMGGKSNRFLMDISPMLETGRTAEHYRIGIPIDDGRSVAATADIYASSNLKDWEKIAANEPLISLKGDGGTLKSGYIEIPASPRARQERYMMLTISGGSLPENFVDITAIFAPTVALVADDTALFSGKTEDSGKLGKLGKSFVYDTEGIFPLREVQFILGSPGVYSAKIEYRRSSSGEWRHLANTTLYLTRGTDGETANGAVSARSGARYFRISFPDSGPSVPPEMRIAWRPKEAVFMAQGEKPYLLACGSLKNAPSLERPDLIGKILSAHSSAPELLEAKIAEKQKNDDRPIRKAEKTATDKAWQKYAVWGVLAAGAVFFSWAAWSLIRRDAGRDSGGRNT